MYYESEVMAPWPEWEGPGSTVWTLYRANMPLAQMEWLGCSDQLRTRRFDVGVVSLPLAGTIDGRILLAARPCRARFVGVQ
jgi:hypothetical protein